MNLQERRTTEQRLLRFIHSFALVRRCVVAWRGVVECMVCILCTHAVWRWGGTSVFGAEEDHQSVVGELWTLFVEFARQRTRPCIVVPPRLTMSGLPQMVQRNLWRKSMKLKRVAGDTFSRWNIVKGDTVQIISGMDKGKQGEVLRVDRKMNKVYVEGCVLRRQRVRSQTGGGVSPFPGAVHVSNVQLVDPETGAPTKVKRMHVDGEKVRVSKKTGNVIPKPVPLGLRTRRLDMVPADQKTTAAEYVLEKTFVPPTYGTH